jgi:adenylate kinase family enzyme
VLVQRVAVVGSGGAGKTTFATALGRRTGLPVIHLDRLHWKPGWVETPPDEWRVVQARALVGARWIVDGNYGGTFDVRFSRADTIVVLALSRWRCTARVITRSVRHWGRDVQADGCRERLDPSFIRWVWHYARDSRPRLQEALAAHQGVARLVELRTPREVRAFLDESGPD